MFFSGEKLAMYWCIDFLICCSLPSKSFHLQISDKTNSWVTSVYSTVCWEKVDGILHASSKTMTSYKCSYPLWFTSLSNSIFPDETSSLSNVLMLLSYYVSINLFFWATFIFLQTFLLIKWISPSSEPWTIEPSLSFSTLFPRFSIS